jgi:hypothetical protein
VWGAVQVINVDPKSLPGDNSRRIEIKTHEYLQVASLPQYTVLLCVQQTL